MLQKKKLLSKNAILLLKCKSLRALIYKKKGMLNCFFFICLVKTFKDTSLISTY